MSDFSTTIQADGLMMDGSESVTFTSKAASGNTNRTVTDAIRSEIRRSEVLASNGYFTMRDSVWELPAVSSAWSAAVIEPKEGDTITDASSVVWAILEVQIGVYDTVYRCISRRERA